MLEIMFCQHRGWQQPKASALNVTANIFIGFDRREECAFHVLGNSILRRASMPVSITPIRLPDLANVLTRPRNPLQSTDFSFSRFLVPYLSGFKGWSLYLDCDMLFQADVAELWQLRGDDYAVQVVKHEHIPSETHKFLGARQTAYARKNWSSLMLFNNERCRALSPDYVNTASGLELHQFKWLADDLIGDLPQCWNHLVDVSTSQVPPKNVHFTLGGPYFADYASTSFAKEWFEERECLVQALSQTN
jgi:hypothetical protein